MNSEKHREEILKQIKEIVRYHLQGVTAKVYLFGSWARHRERNSSDIDIAIELVNPSSKGVISTIREAFEESTIPYRIEVVNLDDTNIDFKNKVVEEGIRWNV
ncbi:nucleotidyltransferase family protein [Bacillus sp. FJAT-45350]|uniref:nucleotidyltransferase family protein n=1 Tax=Bacillus sp. FJAT-45350 TaxID=2011014 RepID=UPI000BB90953|nr:nucleotidyltransferase domain-containing protein [Bacillus sp. FJAT-45350]